MYPPRLAFYSSTPQQGKSTACRMLEQSYGCVRLSFAAPLKDMLGTMLEHCLLSDDEIERYSAEAKEQEIPLLHKSYRYLARTLGTEWGREVVGYNIWVDIMENKIKTYAHWPGGVCIDDIRFQNELEMLQRNNFEIIQVVRSVNRDPSQDQHPSDTALRGFTGFDHVIHNNGSLQDLRNKLKLIIEDY
jgi:hypothetical protein